MIGAAGAPRWRFGGARGTRGNSVGPPQRGERVATTQRSGPCHKWVVTTLNRRWRATAEAARRYVERLTARYNLRSCNVLPIAARGRHSSRAATASLALLLHFCEPYPAVTDRWKRVSYEEGAMAQSWRFGFRD